MALSQRSLVPQTEKCRDWRSAICGVRGIFLLVAFTGGIFSLAAFDRKVPLSIEAANLALEAAELAQEAAFDPVEVPPAIRAVQRAEAVARAAQETALELDLGLLAEDLKMHPTLVRRQAKLVETDVQRIEDESDF